MKKTQDFQKTSWLSHQTSLFLTELEKDFDGLKYFFEDPFIPENGWADRDWLNDFQLTLHIQDELKPITDSGNIFLTNIHRVFLNEDAKPSIEEMFFGQKAQSRRRYFKRT